MRKRLRALLVVGLLAGFGAVVAPTAAFAADFTVNTTADTVDDDFADGVCSDGAGACSLRAAVQQANASAGPDTITLNSGTSYAVTIGGAGEDAAATGDLDITSDITIVTDGAVRAVISASDANDRVFDVLAGGSLTITNVAATDGDVSGQVMGSGGIVRNAGNFTAIDSRLRRGNATRAGGGIEVSPGGVTSLDNSQIDTSDAGSSPGNGGGLHISGNGIANVTDSSFIDNLAVEGGGLWNSSTGTLTVDGSAFNVNEATGIGPDQGGGGIYTDGPLSISNSSFDNNFATGTAGSGGGILNNGGLLLVSGVSLDGNGAERAGGAIESAGGTVNISESELATNNAGTNPGNGGGLHVGGGGTANIDNTDVHDNQAVEGAGLWNCGSCSMTVNSLSIYTNTATGDLAEQGGGGIYNDSNGDGGGGTLNITEVSITQNEAIGTSGSGGGILNSMGAITLNRSAVSQNFARRAGGGLETVAGTATIVDGNFVGNEVGDNPGNGGGVHQGGAGTTTVTNSTFDGNSATGEGGGLWNSAVGFMSVSQTLITGNAANGAAADNGGGGLFNDGGTLQVENSVVANNSAASAGGGVLAVLGEGDTSLIHVTVTANTSPGGSGVATIEGESVRVGNSIVSGNTGSDDCVGTVSSIGGNLLGNCAGVAIASDTDGVNDPNLGAGFVPNAGSPAIDNGIAANGRPVDLNDGVRPVGAGFDSGALEVGAVPGGGPGTDPVVPGGGGPGTPPGPADTTTTSTVPSTTPDTTPGGTTPGDTAPGDTTPGATVPGDTTPPDVGGQDIGSNNGSLSRTGSNSGVLLGFGVLLLMAGTATVLARRRYLTQR